MTKKSVTVVILNFWPHLFDMAPTHKVPFVFAPSVVNVIVNKATLTLIQQVFEKIKPPLH